jgi:hypothetical protein
MFIIENPVKMIPPFTETAIYWGDGNDTEGKKVPSYVVFL